MAGAPSGYYSNVLLGYVDERIEGKYVGAVDYTTSKIGGSPDWMPGRVPCLNDLSCPLCKSFLSLITQVYAPLENSPYHRTLYLFACLRKPCWNSSKSWKCFRTEIEDDTPKASSVLPAVNNSSFQTTDWAEDADNWGSEEEDGDEGEDENGNNGGGAGGNLSMMKGLSIHDNYPDYAQDGEEEEEEEEEISTTSTSDFSASTEHHSGFEDVSGSRKSGGASGQLRATAVIEDEVEGDRSVVIIDSPDEALRASAAESIPSLFFPTDNVNPGVSTESVVFQGHFLYIEEEVDVGEEVVSEHERRLLWEFRNKESSLEDEEEKGLLNVGGGASGNNADVYEKAVPRHGDVFFHKFLTIIQKNPGQVLRYSRDSNRGPLLMSKLSSKNSKTPDKCSSCGGPLVFEFQILSSILSFLKTEVPGEGEIEFGTVIVFSCKKSCYTSTETYRSETLLVQAEPM